MSFDLLTGATGFLGSYLLRDALAAGRRVAVLVRAGSEQSAAERVQGLLARFQEEGVEVAEPPKILQGDLHRPDLGLDEAARAWIADNCSRVVHCAASITFQARRGEPYRSNVDGTRYLLDLCRASDVPDFHLISTAYVCGGREGLVLESELECGQEFSNDYERSKFMSETLVRQAAFLERWTVYRPSVIVGDSTTGFASSDDGLYAFLRVASIFAGETPEGALDRLGLTARDRVNLVPVDWVSATINHLLDHPGAPFTTYHLTHPVPIGAREVLDAASDLIGKAPRVPSAALEDLLAVYGPYLRHHCAFDRTNIERDAPHLTCPSLEGAVLDRLVSFVASRPSHRASGPPRLALTVAGSGGGHFDLSAPGEVTDLTAAEVAGSVVRAYCSGEVLERLRARDVTVERAIYAGVLVVEGDPSLFATSMGLLETYVAEAPWAVAGAGGVG